MKSVGMVRKLDELSRIVLPMELRKKFDIKYHDPFEMFIEGDHILLKKFEIECIFCGSGDN
jgi:transcriptional pleiotropic regulator of transition state genes